MFFKKIVANKGFIKSVEIYISEIQNQIIIAPMCINADGILYEQETCSILSYPIEYLLLGNEVIRNINMFTLKNKDLKDQKEIDWPAFKCSKLKTLKSFKEVYFRLSVSGVNESNIILSIEAPLTMDDTLIIKSIISANERKEVIGERITKVYKSCKTQIAKLT